jgi:hypothetical protein
MLLHRVFCLWPPYCDLCDVISNFVAASIESILDVRLPVALINELPLGQKGTDTSEANQA